MAKMLAMTLVPEGLVLIENWEKNEEIVTIRLPDGKRMQCRKDNLKCLVNLGVSGQNLSFDEVMKIYLPRIIAVILGRLDKIDAELRETKDKLQGVKNAFKDL